MKKQQKKAFTLVELLVVIAILAILASVAVVGYTAFIKNAAVSNDENVATQLTRYLEALQADSTGDYYQKEITAGNAREITKYILEESGIEELVPESLKYGYNFYFDLTEGEYVLKRGTEVGRDARNVIFGRYAYAEGEEESIETRLENCFTEDGRYFFVDTDGSEIAEIIEGLYAFDGTKATFSDLQTKIEQLKGDDAAIKSFVDNSVIVTNEANYKVASDPTNIIFVDDVKYIGTASSEWSNDGWSAPVVPTGDDEYALATTTGNVTIPSSVEVVEKNALNLNTTEDKEAPVIVIDKPVSEVAGLAGESFTNVNMTLDDGNTYKITNNNQIENTETKETVDLELKYENPLKSFDIKAEEVKDLVVNMENSKKEKIAYVVWSAKASFDMYSYNRKGEDGLPSHVQDSEIKWSIDDTTLATINANTGLITFNDTRPDDKKNSFTVTATVGTGEEAITQTYKVYASAVYGATVKLAGQEMTASSTHTLVFNNTVDGEKGSYTISVTPLYSCLEATASIKPNTDIAVTFGATNLTWSEDAPTTINVHKDASGTKTETVTIKCGSYTAVSGKSVTLFDAKKLPYAVKNDDIKYVGNSNTLSASDFFIVNPATTAPSDVKLMVYKNSSDAASMQFDPNRTKVSTDTEDDFYVSSNEVVGFNTAFQFHGTQTSGEVVLCLVSGDKIVSPEVKVTVVNGYNVRTAAQADINWQGGTQSYVLLNDIALWSGGDKTNAANYIKIGANQTLWGNLCTLNIQNGYYKANEASSGIVGLWGTICDTKIVGDTYKNFGISVTHNYGASAVTSKSNSAQLVNCYVSGCRSPLRLDAGVTVTDCVFFGGRYSNIDLPGTGVLTLKGTNYTVNQGYEGSVGVGIAAWFTDNTKTIVNEGTLKQYNFLNKNTTGNLFKIEYAISSFGIIVDIPGLFTDILSNSEYNLLKFNISENDASNPYVNAGIICLDYGATGDVDMSGIEGYKSEEKTINLCKDWIWSLGSSLVDSISDNDMPNKVWTPDPSIKAYQDMFAESQDAEYMATFEPDNFELSWAE